MEITPDSTRSMAETLSGVCVADSLRLGRSLLKSLFASKAPKREEGLYGG